MTPAKRRKGKKFRAITWVIIWGINDKHWAIFETEKQAKLYFPHFGGRITCCELREL